MAECMDNGLNKYAPNICIVDHIRPAAPYFCNTRRDCSDNLYIIGHYFFSFLTTQSPV